LKPVVCRRVVGRLPPFPRRGTMDLSCEIARIRTRDFHLTTGTFNLVVKDRSASPPERRVFSPGDQFSICIKNDRLSSKLVWELGKATRSLSRLSTRCIHRLSTCYSQRGVMFRAYFTHATERIFRSTLSTNQCQNSARADAEDIPLIKDHFGGLAKNAKALRGTLSPNRTPWPGLNYQENLYLVIRCRTPTRVSTSVRLATHCSRRVYL
jgi:hypothetical protein